MMRIKILGHRGSKEFPENTLPAFEDALKHADGFEFDVQYSKDGIPVVIHDETVDRTTNGKGRVESYTLDALQRLNVLGNDNKPLTGVVLPTLAQVMDLVDQYIKKRPEIVINIEIKDVRSTSKVVDMVENYVRNKGWQYTNIICSSFEHEALRQAKQRNPSIPLGILYEPEQEPVVKGLIEELDPYALHPSLSELDSAVFNPKTCGKPLVVWVYGEKAYPDNIPDIKKALHAEPVILITNYPKGVKQEVQKWADKY